MANNYESTRSDKDYYGIVVPKSAKYWKLTSSFFYILTHEIILKINHEKGFFHLKSSFCSWDTHFFKIIFSSFPQFPDSKGQMKLE